jgi:hypothetical protein
MRACWAVQGEEAPDRGFSRPRPLTLATHSSQLAPFIHALTRRTDLI